MVLHNFSYIYHWKLKKVLEKSWKNPGISHLEKSRNPVIWNYLHFVLVCITCLLKQNVIYIIQQKLDGTEKEPFSMEELLCKIIEDHHASKELLANALPVFQQIV